MGDEWEVGVWWVEWVLGCGQVAWDEETGGLEGSCWDGVGPVALEEAGRADRDSPLALALEGRPRSAFATQVGSPGFLVGRRGSDAAAAVGRDPVGTQSLAVAAYFEAHFGLRIDSVPHSSVALPEVHSRILHAAAAVAVVVGCFELGIAVVAAELPALEPEACTILVEAGFEATETEIAAGSSERVASVGAAAGEKPLG